MLLVFVTQMALYFNPLHFQKEKKGINPELVTYVWEQWEKNNSNLAPPYTKKHSRPWSKFSFVFLDSVVYVTSRVRTV